MSVLATLSRGLFIVDSSLYAPGAYHKLDHVVITIWDIFNLIKAESCWSETIPYQIGVANFGHMVKR